MNLLIMGLPGAGKWHDQNRGEFPLFFASQQICSVQPWQPGPNGCTCRQG